MILLYWLLCINLSWAEAPPIPFQEGQFVYTYPDDWRPKGISERGLADLQQTAEKLHYPFYVVFVKGKKLGGKGNPMQRTQQATDNLVSNWGAENGFDISKYSIFFVAWGEHCDRPPNKRKAGTICKYFLNTGSEFINGPAQFLPSRDHKTYTKKFLQSVIRTPQDPKSGVKNVMLAVDNMLWDRTDPVKIKAREKAKKEAALKRRHSNATYTLGKELRRLDQMLEEKDIIPTNSDYDSRSERGWKLMKSQPTEDNISKVKHLSEELYLSNQALYALVKKKRQERMNTLMKRMGICSVISIMFLSALVFLLWKIIRRRKFEADFQKDVKAFEEALQNAKVRYVDANLDDVEQLREFTNVEGKTVEKLQWIKSELDEIYICLCAMDEHLQRCKAKASKTGFLDVDGMKKAYKMLNEPFTFDTQIIDQSELFGPPSKQISITPKEMQSQLQANYEAVIAWKNKLEEAALKQYKSASKLMPHDTMDNIFTLAASIELPMFWLDDHPLFGDDEQDKIFYERLETHRWRDPLQYIEVVEAELANEQNILQRIQSLVDIHQQIEQHKILAPPNILGCAVNPDDDPAQLLRHTQLEEANFKRSLTFTKTKDTTEVLELGQNVVLLYQKTTAKGIEIQQSVQSYKQTEQRLEQQQVHLKGRHDKIQLDIKQLLKTHLRAADALEELHNAQRLLDQSKPHLQNAKELSKERYYLDAKRQHQKTEDLQNESIERLNSTNASCAQMREEERLYNEKLREMNKLHGMYNTRVVHYGGANLDRFVQPSMASGPVDYLVLMQTLESTIRGWQQLEYIAKKAYVARQEAERRRIEAKRRAAAKRRRKAAARRRSSWSSSSSSSWSSSSSSSSSSWSSSGGGGSFGGGSSSGGGGGW